MTITGITVVEGVALQPGPPGAPGAQGPQGPPGAIQTLDVLRGWMTLQYQVPTDLTYAPGGQTNWDTEAHPNARLTISGGNTTMGAPTNVHEGAYYALRIQQDPTTPRTFTWNPAYKWPSVMVSGSPVPNVQQPSNTPGAIDVFHFRGGMGQVLQFVGAMFNMI